MKNITTLLAATAVILGSCTNMAEPSTEIKEVNPQTKIIVSQSSDTIKLKQVGDTVNVLFIAYKQKFINNLPIGEKEEIQVKDLDFKIENNDFRIKQIGNYQFQIIKSTPNTSYDDLRANVSISLIGERELKKIYFVQFAKQAAETKYVFSQENDSLSFPLEETEKTCQVIAKKLLYYKGIKVSEESITADQIGVSIEGAGFSAKINPDSETGFIKNYRLKAYRNISKTDKNGCVYYFMKGTKLLLGKIKLHQAIGDGTGHSVNITVVYE